MIETELNEVPKPNGSIPIKFIVIGMEASGKSSFIQQFVNEEVTNNNAKKANKTTLYSVDPSEKYPVRIEFEERTLNQMTEADKADAYFVPTQINPPDFREERATNKELIDQEVREFKKQRKILLGSADAFLLTLDMTNQTNFNKSVTEFMNNKAVLGKNKRIILVGTKADDVDHQQVSEEEIKKVAKQYGVPYVITSAKDNVNITEIYKVFIPKILSEKLSHLKEKIKKENKAEIKKENKSSPSFFGKLFAYIPAFFSHHSNENTKSNFQQNQNSTGFAEFEFPPSLKFLVSGEPHSGKSTLISMFAEESHFPYVSNEILENEKVISKNMIYRKEDDFQINLRLLERPKTNYSSSDSYKVFRNIDGMMIMVDMTNKASLENLSFHIKEANTVSSPNLTKIIVGTKADDSAHQEMTEADIKKVAEKYNIPYRCRARLRPTL